jgi:hypothetical protein
MIGSCPFKMPEQADAVRSLDTFLYFVWEREAIRLARENDIPRERWTADPVLGALKFCNIRRRDDRVTQWVVRHVIRPHYQRADLWFTLLAVRLINWPPTLAELLERGVLPCRPADFDADRFVRTIEDRKRQQPKVYSSAYMVYPTGAVGRLKSESLARVILPAAAGVASEVHAALREPSVERFTVALASAYGVSTFMSGQVAADLTYSLGQLGRATDLYTWAPVGPGSSRGLNYLRGRPLGAQWAQADFNSELIELRSAIVRELHIMDLTLHDVQNCLCEYSKYARAMLGDGAARNLYHPETEF